jgi:hypothetical protein
MGEEVDMLQDIRRLAGGGGWKTETSDIIRSLLTEIQTRNLQQPITVCIRHNRLSKYQF